MSGSITWDGWCACVGEWRIWQNGVMLCWVVLYLGLGWTEEWLWVEAVDWVWMYVLQCEGWQPSKNPWMSRSQSLAPLLPHCSGYRMSTCLLCHRRPIDQGCAILAMLTLDLVPPPFPRTSDPCTNRCPGMPILPTGYPPSAFGSVDTHNEFACFISIADAQLKCWLVILGARRDSITAYAASDTGNCSIGWRAEAGWCEECDGLACEMRWREIEIVDSLGWIGCGYCLAAGFWQWLLTAVMDACTRWDWAWKEQHSLETLPLWCLSFSCMLGNSGYVCISLCIE